MEYHLKKTEELHSYIVVNSLTITVLDVSMLDNRDSKLINKKLNRAAELTKTALGDFNTLLCQK